MKPALSRSAAIAAVAGMLALSGCAIEPASTILSRLPPGEPGAAAGSAHPLTPAEKERYDAIDRQVLREQDDALAAEAAARAWAAYAPPVTYYGGYYGGGWGPGWGTGFSYGYPGWWW